MISINVQIEVEDVHTGFAEESKLAAFCVFLHQRPHFLLAHAALTSYTGNLKLRRIR